MTDLNEMDEQMYVDHMLHLLERSTQTVKDFGKISLLGKSKIEILDFCDKARIPCQFFEDEATYYSDERPSCVARFLMVNDRCVSQGMST